MAADDQDSQNPQGLGAGTVLGGRYRLEAPIGRGGVGDVWRARHDRIGKPVAVKVLRPRDDDDDGWARKRMLREARLLSEIRHPSVVEVLDFEGGGESPFLVMELLEGRTLQQALRDEGRMPWSKAGPLLRQILEGLSAAHRAGVIHRDIKPANVMLLDGHRIAKLIDFGIAGAWKRTRITVAGEVLGTPHFMSPEQSRTMALTEASDVYSYGCLAFSVLAGRPPYVGSIGEVARKHLRAPIPDVAPRVDADVPRAVCLAVERCLEKDPNRRFQSADALLRAMFPASGAGGERRRASRSWVGLLGAVTALAAATAFLVLRVLPSPMPAEPVLERALDAFVPSARSAAAEGPAPNETPRLGEIDVETAIPRPPDQAAQRVPEARRRARAPRSNLEESGPSDDQLPTEEPAEPAAVPFGDALSPGPDEPAHELKNPFRGMDRPPSG